MGIDDNSEENSYDEIAEIKELNNLEDAFDESYDAEEFDEV